MKSLSSAACAAALCGLSYVSQTSVAHSATSSPPHYVFTALPSPTNYSWGPGSINNRGEMLGRLERADADSDADSHAGLYTDGKFVDLHLLVPGRDTNQGSRPQALNDRGQVLFYTTGSMPQDQYYLYEAGHVQDFAEVSGRPDLVPLAINNSGQIVGLIEQDRIAVRAFSYLDGEIQLLGAVHHKLPNSAAVAVNNLGLSVGAIFDELSDAEPFRAAILAPGQTRLLLPSSRVNSSAIDVNDRGHVIIRDGLLWLKEGKVIELPFSPFALNNSDQVIGFNNDPPALVFYSGNITYRLQDLIDPVPGWQFVFASDINDHGQIVGVGLLNGHRTGFLLTPADQ